MNQEQKMIVAEAFGLVLGQIGHYVIMRKLGAPKYAAYFVCIVTAQLRDISNPLKPRVDKAFKR